MRSYIKEWYSKEFVKEHILQDVQDRETMVMYANKKVKRPVYLYNEGDILVYVEEGGISFHRSVEAWEDVGEFKNIKYYDIIIDIDIEAPSEIPLKDQLKAVVEAAKYILNFLQNFGFKQNEIGIKYSGHHGIHIRLTTEGINQSIFGIPISKGHPILSKVVLEFLNEILKQYLSTATNPVLKYIKLDTMVASPRHMIRAVMSVNEKDKPGVSYPLSLEELEKLPEEYTKYKFPKCLSLEEPTGYWVNIKPSTKIIDLIRIATLHYIITEATNSYLRKIHRGQLRKFRSVKLGKLSPEEEIELLFPPCIKNILSGMKDGRKRAVFILINFLAHIGWDWDRIEQLLWEWNERNEEPLKERYIEYQLEWHKKKYDANKRGYLPPNCDNDVYYKDMVSINGPVCQPDELCHMVKNPLVYYVKKLKMLGIKKTSQKAEDKEVPQDLL